MSVIEEENNRAAKKDDTLKPVSPDLIDPAKKLPKPAPDRERKIKELEEKLGISRDIAERMIDESGGPL